MDPSGKNGFFVGYSEQPKYYRVYIPRYRQIELSIDVTFNENTTFRKSKKDKEDEEALEEISTQNGPPKMN